MPASRDSEAVLVLNFNYQPLNITSAQRAVSLICLGKAHALETDSRVFRSEHLHIKMPTVVRLDYYVRRPLPVLRVSRKSIFARDRHTCQYCGNTGVTLTLDHVIPKERKGKTCWENLVCCCTKCNNIKANRSPAEAGLKLINQPRRPKYIPYITYTRFVAAMQNPVWQPYLVPYGDGFPVLAEEEDDTLIRLKPAGLKPRHAHSLTT
ncbi:MAG: HNH endonuclease [Armatimonadetes bacterium]|nr:HNH endonuclease [Armatimonadota bacterium]NIO74912.1 HNH endonuclease [Armatimonadota bacterium]NIO96613.1 HNH endonuclease [Armatimonadota bacterium]